MKSERRGQKKMISRLRGSDLFDPGNHVLNLISSLYTNTLIDRKPLRARSNLQDRDPGISLGRPTTAGAKVYKITKLLKVSFIENYYYYYL